MSARLLPRPWRYILIALALALCTQVLVDRSLTPLSARALPTQAADVIVTTCTSQGLADAMNTLNGTSAAHHDRLTASATSVQWSMGRCCCGCTCR
jgi:hypothetical protein